MLLPDALRHLMRYIWADHDLTLLALIPSICHNLHSEGSSTCSSTRKPKGSKTLFPPWLRTSAPLTSQICRLPLPSTVFFPFLYYLAICFCWPKKCGNTLECKVLKGTDNFFIKNTIAKLLTFSTESAAHRNPESTLQISHPQWQNLLGILMPTPIFISWGSLKKINSC